MRDAAYREDLLFAACVLHDLGLGGLAPGTSRFEVEGADLAAALLTEHGATAAEVDRVWEAIALHSHARRPRPRRTSSQPSCSGSGAEQDPPRS